MILILKKERFENYLFQFFVAKIIQSYNNSKIVTISKNNITILKKILKKNQIINNFKISKNYLTIHIRHLHKKLGSLDTNPLYSKQPDINFYKKVINKLNPDSIKVISLKKIKCFTN